MSDFSGLTLGNYKSFAWQASWGISALVHSQWTAISEGGCSQGLRPPRLLCFVICIPSPRAFNPRSPYLGLGQRSSSGASAETSLSGKEECSLTPKPFPRVHKTAGAFCSVKPPPNTGGSELIHLTLTSALFHGENGKERVMLCLV